MEIPSFSRQTKQFSYSFWASHLFNDWDIKKMSTAHLFSSHVFHFLYLSYVDMLRRNNFFGKYWSLFSLPLVYFREKNWKIPKILTIKRLVIRNIFGFLSLGVILPYDKNPFEELIDRNYLLQWKFNWYNEKSAINTH